MDVTTMNKAVELNNKINNLTDAYNCFDYKPEASSNTVSLNPELIIEYDGDGRDTFKIPMSLSKNLIVFLKEEIIKQRDIAVAEFNNL